MSQPMQARSVCVDSNTLTECARACGANGVALYMILAQHADKDGRCFPSYATLTSTLRIGRARLLNALAALRTAGLLSIEKEHIDGSYLRNVYTIRAAVAVAPPAADPQAAPIPDPFNVETEMIEWATGRGFSDEQIDFQSRRFAEFYRKRPHIQRADWNAEWERWMTSAFKRPASLKTRFQSEPTFVQLGSD